MCEDDSRKFQDSEEISYRIEKLRYELHKMISNHNKAGFDDKIVEMSQYLDKLLVVYMKEQGGKYNEKRRRRP